MVGERRGKVKEKARLVLRSCSSSATQRVTMSPPKNVPPLGLGGGVGSASWSHRVDAMLERSAENKSKSPPVPPKKNGVKKSKQESALRDFQRDISTLSDRSDRSRTMRDKSPRATREHNESVAARCVKPLTLLKKHHDPPSHPHPHPHPGSEKIGC